MWRSRRRTKETRERGDGERSRRRGRVRFCASVLALPCFPRGIRWGEMWKPHCGRAPDCAKESSTLWTLFFGFAAKYLLPNFAITAILESPHPRPPHPGTRKDLPESNLCSGGSGCVAIISTRTIEDLPGSDLWPGRSCDTRRQQVEPAQPAKSTGDRADSPLFFVAFAARMLYNGVGHKR